MAQNKTRALYAAVVTVCLAMGAASVMPLVRAQTPGDSALSSSVRETIGSQVGKRIKVKLVSGQDLEGKVGKIGSDGFVLTELTNMEFFDASVRLDQVAAVMVRRAAK